MAGTLKSDIMGITGKGDHTGTLKLQLRHKRTKKANGQCLATRSNANGTSTEQSDTNDDTTEDSNSDGSNNDDVNKAL
jgi:hypothetical protein